MASASTDVASLIFSGLSLLISASAFGTVFHDRRAKLLARGREGDWLVWKDNSLKPDETILLGIVELYNPSSRANTISSYSYCAITRSGQSIRLFSEISKVGIQEESKADGEEKEQLIHNQTPLVIAPYTGVEVPVLCYMPRRVVVECQEIRVTFGDIHNRHHTTSLWNRQQNKQGPSS